MEQSTVIGYLNEIMVRSWKYPLTHPWVVAEEADGLVGYAEGLSYLRIRWWSCAAVFSKARIHEFCESDRHVCIGHSRVCGLRDAVQLDGDGLQEVPGCLRKAFMVRLKLCVIVHLPNLRKLVILRTQHLTSDISLPEP